MKKRIKSKKLISSLAISTLVLGLFVTTVINANEVEVTSEAETLEVEDKNKDVGIEENHEIAEEETVEENEEFMSSKVTDDSETEQVDRSSLVRADLSVPAFPDSSKPLHDAIIAKYGNLIDIDGNKTISVGEANAYTDGIGLVSQSIEGTVTGIENFKSASWISLKDNQFSGTIPEGISNMTVLTTLDFSSNNLSGEIPVGLGNIGALQVLNLSYNQLTGEIPSSIGSLSSLTQLYLNYNNLSGSIPKELGNLSLLKNLYLHGNNLSGEIPKELENLSSLEQLNVSNNTDLKGNPVEIFASSITLNNLNVKGTGLIQARPNISTLLDANGGIFKGDNLAEALLSNDKTNIVDGLTQIDIDNAQASANYISDATEKKQWQDDIDLAQRMFDAKEQVSELFGDETKTNLSNSTTQKSINDAQEVVSALPDGQLKTDLQRDIDLAQSMLDATTTVNEMFNDDGTIADSVNQSVIDNAQSKVDVLPEGSLKTELQEKINEAQRQFNEKDAKEKVENLFTDGTHTDIIDGLTQGNIDEAQKAVDKLPSGDLKDELQKEIDKAQEMLDAKNKVEDLFADETHTDIPDDLTQTDIDEAQKAVDKLPSGDLKDELQKEIDKAQDMLNAKDTVGDLLDKDGNLNSDVTQKDINKAQDLVNKLPDGDLKDELQAVIDEAQRQLDAQNKKNPSTVPSVVKPSVSGGATTGGSTVNTADTTNVAIYFSLLVSSIALLGLFAKRRKTIIK